MSLHICTYTENKRTTGRVGDWGWRVLGLLLVIYVVGVLRFKAGLGAGVVRALVYGLLPKLLWPLFLLAGLVKR